MAPQNRSPVAPSQISPIHFSITPPLSSLTIVYQIVLVIASQNRPQKTFLSPTSFNIFQPPANSLRTQPPQLRLLAQPPLVRLLV